MPASIREFRQEHKLDYDHEQIIECPYREARFLLVWDDKEWNSVKDWIRVARFAVRKNHPRHSRVELPVSLRVSV
jgi:hypothetical protein